MSQARQIVDALVAKPTLLYEVLRILEDEYSVASPWTTTPGLSLRTKPEGVCLGDIAWDPADPKVFAWKCYATGETGKASTEAEARAEIDKRLQASGFLLP